MHFGELVFYRPTSNHDKHMNKMEARWKVGIYLGIERRSGELILGSSEGTETARCIKRKPESARWSYEDVMAITATPWDPQRRRVQQERPLTRGEHGEVKIIDEEETKVTREAEETDEERFKSKAMQIRRGDVERFGVTEGCPGCKSIRNIAK